MPGRLTTSIAMCTFDGGRFLAGQLESIARQTLLPSELVVFDDSSSDGTAELVRSFASRAPFPVHLTVNPTRLGSTRNFAAAIAACRGEVIFLADQDDVWHPEKIARMSARFVDEPALGCLFSDARIVGEDGDERGESLWSHVGFTPRHRQRVRQGRAFQLLVVRNFVTGATAAFRASHRDLILPMPEAHGTVHDRWLALLIASRAPIAFVPDALVDYRLHAAQQIGPGLRAGSVEERLRDMRENGPAQFAEWAGQLELVRERLHDRGVPLDRDQGRELDRRIEHLRVRASLPAGVAPGLRAITCELLTGRYHRYSNGLLSLAKDLSLIIRT